MPGSLEVSKNSYFCHRMLSSLMFMCINVGYFGVFVLIEYQFLESCVKDNFLYVIYFHYLFPLCFSIRYRKFCRPATYMLFLNVISLFSYWIFSQPIYSDKNNIISF